MRNTVIITLLLLFTLPLGANTMDTLVVGYKISPPFVTTSNGQPVGPSVWLWEQIAEENDLNFKYVQLPLDSLLGSLSNGTIDIGISPLTVTSERAARFDFSFPYFIAHSSLMQREYSALRQAFDFVRSFFSLNFFRALGALAFIILVFGLLVWLFERHENKQEFGKGIHGLWSGFWWSAVTMTTVGYGDKSPRTTGGRIVALVWMFTAIIIISGFTAGIASALTINQIGSSTSSIEDFKEKKLGTIANSGTDEWLQNNFFTNRMTTQQMPELIEALEKKQIDAIAYDRPILREITKADSLQDFMLSDVKFNPQFYALGINKKLSGELKDKINMTLLENIEKMEWRIVVSEHELY